MRWSYCRRSRWHHCCYDRWFLGWRAGLWILVRHAGQETINHDRLHHLDHRLHHRLRSTEHSHADRRKNHQRYLRRYPVRTGTSLHQRMRAAHQAWTLGRFATMGHHLGYPYSLLVSSRCDTITIARLTIDSVSYGASFVGGSNQNADNYSVAVFRIP